MSRRVITVFGSGRVHEQHPAYQQAQTLGLLLARQEFSVCTGGYGGIMAAAPRGAREADGETLAVIIRGSKSAPNPWVQTIHEESTWLQRLSKLIELGDGYVVMDGGIGTLNELLMVWEMGNKGLHQKPIILLGDAPSALSTILKQNPLAEQIDRARIVSSPDEAAALLHETF